MAIDMAEAIKDLPKTNPMYDVIIQRLDAIDFAKSIVQEQSMAHQEE